MLHNCKNCEYLDCLLNIKSGKKIIVEIVKDEDWKDEFTECDTSNEWCCVCPHVTCPKYTGSEEE